MAGYPKIWTFIRHEHWFKKLKANERGAVLEMILMVKEQQDNGHLVVNSVVVLAYELSINRKTLAKLIVKLTSVRPENNETMAKPVVRIPPVLVIINQQPLDLYFPKYLKWQQMTVKDAVMHARESGAKMASYQAEQPIPDQSKQSNQPPSLKRTAKVTNPDHKLVVEYFCQAYQNKIGATYAFHGKEDAGKIKTLLGRFNLPQIKTLIDTMFASNDEFYRTKGGYTIGVLLANDNKLVQELRRKVDDTNDMSALEAKNAATMAKVLQEMECQATPKLSQK